MFKPANNSILHWKEHNLLSCFESYNTKIHSFFKSLVCFVFLNVPFFRLQKTSVSLEPINLKKEIRKSTQSHDACSKLESPRIASSFSEKKEIRVNQADTQIYFVVIVPKTCLLWLPYNMSAIITNNKHYHTTRITVIQK